MNLFEYTEFAEKLALRTQVKDNLHNYFLLHRNRLWQMASHFNLWSARGKKVLEIGPFFSYTPFVLKSQGNEVTVLEGDDPVVYPLKQAYKEDGIELVLCNLFEIFGSPAKDRHRFPCQDGQFDLVVCWETMEHFNFNPVGFVRALGGILKPGGEAFITVPNVAKLENRIKLLLGKGIGQKVEDYDRFYVEHGGMSYGFHWREYAMPELIRLFEMQGFSTVSAAHLLTFQSQSNIPALKKLKRLFGRCMFNLIPSLGTVCAIVAKKEGQAPESAS